MKQRFAAALVISASAFVWASASHATSYNLAAQFSSANNPNSPWSYTYGPVNTLVPHQPTVGNNGNHLEPAIPAAGYFGTGTNLNADTPFIFQSTKNGSQLSLLNDGDFLAGDVVVHSPNDGSILNIIWTAPTAGTVQFGATLSYWYAHSSVDRLNNIGVYYNGNGSIIDATSPVNHNGRSNAGNSVLLDPLGFHLDVGQTIVLTIEKGFNQQSGSLTGIQMVFDFIPDERAVPIPGALPLFASGLAGIGALAWRRKRKAAA